MKISVKRLKFVFVRNTMRYDIMKDCDMNKWFVQVIVELQFIEDWAELLISLDSIQATKLWSQRCWRMKDKMWPWLAFCFVDLFYRWVTRIHLDFVWKQLIVFIGSPQIVQVSWKISENVYHLFSECISSFFQLVVVVEKIPDFPMWSLWR